MDFSTLTSSPLKHRSPALAVAFHGTKPAATAAALIEAGLDLKGILGQDFKGKAGETLVLHRPGHVAADRLILVGLGEASEFKPRTLLSTLQALASTVNSLGLASFTTTLLDDLRPLDVDLRLMARLLARSLATSVYRYGATLSKKPEAPALKSVTVSVSDRKAATAVTEGCRQGAALAKGMNLTRELGNLPGNLCTPTHLASTARQLARDHGLKVEVLERKQIEALKMGSFLAVAQGSDEPPRFIVLHYRGAESRKEAPVVLVGKGITFDSGGISIKPAGAMDEMKYDMSGAGTVLGVMKAAAEAALPINLVGLIPSCENLPSGRATKPGDVVTTMAGLTVEVLNTDAEGRLILCDALTYAERFKPRAVVDIATLTGACVTALGHVNTGLFATNDELADALLAAGRRAQDPAWRMPLDEEYHEQLKSPFADLANIGGPAGGAVTAACFLSRFAKAYPWAHLDIAGTAWRGGATKGASGRPVPMLFDWLLGLSAH